MIAHSAQIFPVDLIQHPIGIRDAPLCHRGLRLADRHAKPLLNAVAMAGTAQQDVAAIVEKGGGGEHRETSRVTRAQKRVEWRWMGAVLPNPLNSRCKLFVA